MPYSLGIAQDVGCSECGCRCGYWQARDVDNWQIPPSNPEVKAEFDVREYAPKQPRRLGEVWTA